MSAANSKTARREDNPPRPPGETTLFWHTSGRWAKKIRGQLKYFGRGTYHEALDLYQSQAEDLHAGRLPRSDDPEALTVRGLAEKFLTTKHAAVKTGELSQRSLEDYAATCRLVIKAFGKGRLASDLGPDDFQKLKKRMGRTWGLVRVGNEMNRVRIIFSYGYKNQLLDRPMVFGEGFKRPSKKAIRLDRRGRPDRGEGAPKMFEAEEIRRMLAAAGQPLKSMLLLGINCAFGNSDVATLPLSAVDLAGGWVNYHRPKTGIDRRIPLWPETVEALREWLSRRKSPTAPKYAGVVFTTKHGAAWSIEGRALSNEVRKLLDKLDINGHRGFYCLRHTVQTIGDEAGDFISTRRIMGHASNDIADVYRERISDERLRKVTDHVRAWLFG